LLPGAVYEHIKHYRISHAAGEALSLVRAANKFFADTTPWLLAKQGETEKLGGILYACCEVIRITSIVLYPIMPTKMREVRALLSLDDSTLTLDSARTFFELQPGTAITVDQPVFPRLEAAKPVGKKEAEQPKPEPKPGAAAAEGVIEIADFARVKLVVAQVLHAEKVDGADKLLKLRIDLGNELRQIVAGIAQHYTPKEIVGKKIIVVRNLKPAVIRGIESNGMLLAAKKGDDLFIVTPEGDLPPGATVG
jgi:methionyl-tRNA synthetase